MHFFHSAVYHKFVTISVDNAHNCTSRDVLNGKQTRVNLIYLGPSQQYLELFLSYMELYGSTVKSMVPLKLGDGWVNPNLHTTNWKNRTQNMEHIFAVVHLLQIGPSRQVLCIFHWLTSEKGVHQFRYFLPLTRTPHSILSLHPYQLTANGVPRLILPCPN